MPAIAMVLSVAVATEPHQSPVARWDPPSMTDHPAQSDLETGRIPLTTAVAAGERLFLTKFNTLDGAGRPEATGDSKPTFRQRQHGRNMIRTSGPDANSCGGCHNQPRAGGSGEFAVNVFVGAQFADPPTSSIAFRETSERNTLTMFGSSAIEMLAREMTSELLALRRQATRQAQQTGQPAPVGLLTKGVSFGVLTGLPDGTYDASRVEGVDEDLVVKPFGFKGVVISIREFTINALNQHFGVQAVERFGWERTGVADFDGDGVPNEFSVGQVTALTLFQAALPPQNRVSAHVQTHARGEELFRQVGCAGCHRPDLKLDAAEFTEPNPYNRPGNVNPSDVRPIVVPIVAGGPGAGVERLSSGDIVVHAFTDLKRHVICDAGDTFFCNETRRQDRVPTDQFLTPKLWDLASSAPYGHRGDCTTLSEAIVHHAGEARDSTSRFLSLADEDKKAIIRFLLSLGEEVPPDNSTSVGSRRTQ